MIEPIVFRRTAVGQGEGRLMMENDEEGTMVRAQLERL